MASFLSITDRHDAAVELVSGEMIDHAEELVASAAGGEPQQVRIDTRETLEGR